MFRLFEEKILENHKLYTERINLFKNYGWNFIQERKSIIKVAEPIIGKILEIGAGKGYFTLELAKYNFNFISIDCSSEELEYALLNLQYYGLQDQVLFKKMDSENLDFDDNSFDTVFSVNMLHHLEKPYKCIDEMLRVLNKGGKLIISDFTKKGFEVIDRIHKSEGKTHSVNSVYIEDIKKYLSEKYKEISRKKTIFQDTIVVIK